MHVSKPLSNTPPYPFLELRKLANNLREQGISVIDFGIGDPSSPTPDFVIQAAQKSLQEKSKAGYPADFGNQDYLQACADYLKKNFQVELDSKTEIGITNGSKEAVFHYAFCHLNPGDIAIVPTPGYPSMKNGTIFAGATPFYVPLKEENNFLIDYQAIPEDIVRKAKIIWIQYPNSPTGASPSLDWYKDFYTWASQNDIIIAADEGCYIDLYFDKKPHSILEVARENIITFYSLSKRNNMTNYRIGFVAGDEKLVQLFGRLKSNIDSGIIDCAQDAAIAALRDDNHVQSMRDEYREKKEILLDGFRAVDFDVREPDATFYIWQKAPQGMTGVEFAKKLLEKDLAIVCTPGAWISQDDFLGQNPGENFVRFALVPTKEEVKTAVERLKNFY